MDEDGVAAVAADRAQQAVRSDPPRVKTFCSTPGVSPRSAGMIQIWMNRIGSVGLAFCSECSAPEPSVIRWTEPAGSGPGAPPTSS